MELGRICQEAQVWKLLEKVKELECEGSDLMEGLRQEQKECGEMVRMYRELREEKEALEDLKEELERGVEEVRRGVERVKDETLRIRRHNHSKALSLLASQAHFTADALQASNLPTISHFQTLTNPLSLQIQTLEREEMELMGQIQRDKEAVEGLKKVKEELGKREVMYHG